MHLPDLVVGIMAAIVGLALFVIALADSPWLARLPKSRWLIDAVGKTAARAIIALLGLTIIALAALVASGWRINWG